MTDAALDTFDAVFFENFSVFSGTGSSPVTASTS